MRAKRALLALALSQSVALAYGAPPPPPAAPVRDVAETHFGVTVHDPYRYFEDLKDPTTSAWMKAQAAYARSVLDRIPQRKAILAEIARYDGAAPARVRDVEVNLDYVYYEKRRANEDNAKLYVRKGTGGAERMLVDPDRHARKGTHAAIDYYAPSQDNRYVAVGISEGGSEQSVIRIVEVASGRMLADSIDRAEYAQPAWLPDGRLLYSRLQKLPPGAPATEKYQNQRVFVHTIGADPESDVALFGAGVNTSIAIKPVELVFANIAPKSDYVIALAVNGVQREIRMWTTPLAALAGDKTPWTAVVDTSDDVTDAAVFGSTIYLLTHKDASRFKVLELSLADPAIAKARTIVEPSENVLTGLSAASDALYVRRMKGGISSLLRVDYASSEKQTQIALPFDGDLEAVASDTRVPGLMFVAGGWTRSPAIYAYDPKANRIVDTGLQPSGRYDRPANLESEEVVAKAPDGTEIPLSLVYRKGLARNAQNPTILYGYGAYGISMTPFYRPTWLPWFERGGVLAVAHVRGGGENGQDWYKAGFKETKSNTWNDAIACAQWLIDNKVTSPARLAIMGGSAGGIFVGRSITERPDLFAAAIDDVPASDFLRAEFSANGVPNIPEFGSVTTEAGFKALYAMSPYHHVKDGEKYPAVLVASGFNDPRVDAWEPAKMAARLQAATSSGKPVLLRIDYDAGHGYGTSKTQAYEERADMFAFLFWQFGVPGYQPAL
jgi:prolyl oligopeptidase